MAMSPMTILQRARRFCWPELSNFCRCEVDSIPQKRGQALTPHRRCFRPKATWLASLLGTV